MAYRSRLFDFWKQEELNRGKEIPIAEVERATGLEYRTIRSLLNDATQRFDGPVVSKLCKYFNIASGPVPWLVYEPDE